MTENRPTPYLAIDLEEIRTRYRNLKEQFGREVEIFYSVKANNHPTVISTLLEQGSAFDVASLSEIELVLAAGCPADRVAYSNPIKKPTELAAAFTKGIRLFAFDSEAEIKKLAELAPKSQVYIRLAVSNEGSLWPLTEKFGVDYAEATRLIELAAARGLDPVGVTFHVGSQCLNPTNWGSALRSCAEVFDACAEKGIRLSLVNMGGGLPAQDSASNPPSIESIKKVVKAELADRFDSETRILIEPGRHMVATSGTLVATVIGIAKRGAKTWIYLDTGVYNGLMELYEGFPYAVRTLHSDRPKRKYVLAGPTCDSVDVINKEIVLPELEIGDRVIFKDAGAYTISYDRYNGFDFPETVTVDSA